MNLTECYQLLGLEFGAPYAEIKAAYRRLARSYHPDTNPDDHQAKEKFIALTEAYQCLLRYAQSMQQNQKTVWPSSPVSVAHPPDQTEAQSPSPSPPPQPRPQVNVKVQSSAQTAGAMPELSVQDLQLKRLSYQQLQQLLKHQRFPRAIALVEGLGQRLPHDPEVRQWQAITYQQFGHYLVGQRQLDKARIYLKKALRTDPHNRTLWAEVEKDFRRIEQIY
jgi:tetratricopeptide (TPR) repeat protein